MAVVQSGPRRRPRQARAIVDPLEVSGLYHGESTEEPPDPIEWVVDPRFLDRPRLYPRQATLLKLIFLRDDLLTQYDHDVVGEWAESFERTGNNGCQPDVLRRVKICQEQGRPWFREVVAPIGRRGSKGHMGALTSSYVLWHYMHRPGGPQEYYGIDRDKRLSCMVFAGKREQAKANQWQDLVNVITGAPCFAPYISRNQAERLTLFAPTDRLRAQRMALRGIRSETDIATFEIVPRESTLMAGRGPTSFVQLYDEWAHVVATGANRSAEDVWTAATPSLDQFGVDAYIWEGSSPWQMTGQFYQNACNAVALEDNGSPSYPEMLLIQLPSWGLYTDWEVAHKIAVRPRARVVIDVMAESADGAGPVLAQVEQQQPAQRFAPLRGAIQEYDDQMRQIERANPETFAVERRSEWAAVVDAYLNQRSVEAIFTPPPGGFRTLTVARSGAMGTTYVAHGDPASVGDRFGFAIAHMETEDLGVDDDGLPRLRKHVVFDVLNKWSADEWADRQVHYVRMHDGDRNVEDELWDYVRAFQPVEFTFDQYAVPSTVQSLTRRAARAQLPTRPDIFIVPATKQLNFVRWEVFKAAANLGLVHAPVYFDDGQPCEASAIAEAELKFLQRRGNRIDHPTAGPVQSKDVADAMCECVWKLIGAELAIEIGQALSEISIRGVAGRGLRTLAGQERATQEQEVFDALSRLTARGRRDRMPPQHTTHRGVPGTRRGWGKR